MLKVPLSVEGLNKIIHPISMGGIDVLPIIEGGKGVGVTNGITAGHFAKAGAVGTFSGVNAQTAATAMAQHFVPQLRRLLRQVLFGMSVTIQGVIAAAQSNLEHPGVACKLRRRVMAAGLVRLFCQPNQLIQSGRQQDMPAQAPPRPAQKAEPARLVRSAA